MKIALLGFAQSGKKTFFSLLTGRKIPESLKDGESLEGVAFIRDPRVDKLSEICRPEKTKYAENTMVLCPDIVEGDAKRKWLETARQCELLCFVVRDFSSPEVYHPAGSIDAKRDIANLEAEIVLADLEMIETRMQRIAKEKRAGRTAAQQVEEQVLEKIRGVLEKEMKPVPVPLEEQELAAIKSIGFLSLKPVIWAINVDEQKLGSVGDLAVEGAFPVSCLIEQEVMALDNASEREEYLKELGMESSGLDTLNSAAYDALGLMSFYTIGKDEVRAWTVRKGSNAPQAAGRVHSDMERGFIRVEVIKYDDLVAAGSEAAVKAQGKVQLKGKDYIMQDGDICHFLFNV